MVRRHSVRSGMRRNIRSSIATDISLAREIVEFLNSLPRTDAEIAEDDPTCFAVWINYGDEWDWQVKNGLIYLDDKYSDDEPLTIPSFYEWAVDSLNSFND